MFISLITEGGGRLFDHNVNGITLLLLHSCCMSITGFSFACILHSNKSAWHVKTRSVQSSFFSLAADCRPAHCVGNYCCRTVAPTNARPANAESETARCGCYAEPPRTATAGSNSASHPAPGYLSPRRPPTVHLAGPSSLAGNVDANHFSAAEVCVPPSARDASEFQSLYVPWPHHVFDLIRMW